MPSTIKRAWPWLWLSALVIALDQWSKHWVVTHLTLGVPKTITPFLNFTLTFNAGGPFGFLGAQSGWQVYLFSIVPFLIAVVLTLCLGRLRRSDIGLALGLSLMIGGAIGNVIDRLQLRYVVDFIDFHIQHWHYATFNVADTAVSLGAVVLVLSLFFFPKKSR